MQMRLIENKEERGWVGTLPYYYFRPPTSHQFFIAVSIIPIISAVFFDTAHSHPPNPPCEFTARIHSSRNSRLVWSCCESCPFTSRTRCVPFLSLIMKSGRYLWKMPWYVYEISKPR